VEIRIGEQVKQFKDGPGAVTRSIKYINTYLQEHNVALEAVCVDGNDVGGNYEEYLKGHKGTIVQVEVLVNPRQETIEEILQDAFDYIGRALPLLQDVAGKFAVNPDETAWSSFAQMIEGVEWIYRVSGHANQLDPGVYGFMADLMSSFGEWLTEMDRAIANKDYGLVADLIQYELVELYEKLRDALSSHIQVEKV
jgi:hypothetical protein